MRLTIDQQFTYQPCDTIKREIKHDKWNASCKALAYDAEELGLADEDLQTILNALQIVRMLGNQFITYEELLTD